MCHVSRVKNAMEVIKVRSRRITFSLHQDVTELVEKYAIYAWIYHDKDINVETGELIEPHYHYYLEVPNARHLSSFASEFNIPENMIEVVRNKVGILRYLTHSTESSKEKYEYSLDDVHSSFDMIAATESYDMESIYDVIVTASSPRDAIRRVKGLGYVGNPLIGVSYVLNVYEKVHGQLYDGIRE